MRIANAPCSWGVLEFESTGSPPPAAQVLDEIAATGYCGTELGDFGYFGIDAETVRHELDRRGLSLVGAFVPVALADRAAHGGGEALALKTARLLGAASADRPLIVLSDATAGVPERTARAGRIAPADRLPRDGWRNVADGAQRIARAVLDQTGLRTVFHHHCATFVETPGEIETLLAMTPPDLLGICLDTGHLTYGGGDPLALLRRHRGRVWHVHFKDCSPSVAARARAEQWDYVTAIRHGLFCELGRGGVDFGAILDELRKTGYDGWIVVEQDVLPSMGTPAASASANRQYLRSLGV